MFVFLYILILFWSSPSYFHFIYLYENTQNSYCSSRKHKKSSIFQFLQFFWKKFHNCNCGFLNTLEIKIWENATILKIHIFVHLPWDCDKKRSIKKGAQRGYPIDFFTKFHNFHTQFVYYPQNQNDQKTSFFETKLRFSPKHFCLDFPHIFFVQKEKRFWRFFFTKYKIRISLVVDKMTMIFY